LDIGAASVTFDGEWGLITLTGSITGNNQINTAGTIVVDGPSITSTAEIANTGNTNGRTINNVGIGSVTITGGRVSATQGWAIRNQTTGEINIFGGTVSTSVSGSSGNAISNGSGEVNISGGTVSASGDINFRAINGSGRINISGGTVTGGDGAAINLVSGIINVSGTADVTSANGFTIQGTITLENSGTSTAERLIITGGTVRNTVSGTTGRAIQNNSTGAVNISGGTVSAPTGRAIHNNITGAINISGGTVSATTGIAVWNEAAGIINVSNTAVVTSANVTATEGTIVLNNSGTSTAERLVITGGTVRNTGTNANARAINNLSRGAVTISNGRVAAENAAGTTGTVGTAVRNNQANGTINITGGTLRAGGTGFAIRREASAGEVSISAPATIQQGQVFGDVTGWPMQ
jgi:hypothetical protein